jgi:hypothetical protein
MRSRFVPRRAVWRRNLAEFAGCAILLAALATACGPDTSGTDGAGGSVRTSDGGVVDARSGVDASASVEASGSADANSEDVGDAAVLDGPMSTGDGSADSTIATDSATSQDAAPLSDAGLAYVAAYCTAVRACCQRGGLGDAGALAGCETALAAAVTAPYRESQGSLVVSPAGLQAWVAALQQTANDCLSPPNAVWNGVWMGTRAIGQPCSMSDECMTGSAPTACVVAGSTADGGTPPGVCHAAPHGSLGGACGSSCATGYSCSFTVYTSDPNAPTALCYASDGLRCDPITSTCVALTALGAPCTSSSDCGDDAYCSTTCKAHVGEGAPCPDPSACFGEFICSSAAVCTRVPFANDFRCAGGVP